jgi:hypothetical protein
MASTRTPEEYNHNEMGMTIYGCFRVVMFVALGIALSFGTLLVRSVKLAKERDSGKPVVWNKQVQRSRRLLGSSVVLVCVSNLLSAPLSGRSPVAVAIMFVPILLILFVPFKQPK